jgi:hypothetical protein
VIFLVLELEHLLNAVAEEFNRREPATLSGRGSIEIARGEQQAEQPLLVLLVGSTEPKVELVETDVLVKLGVEAADDGLLDAPVHLLHMGRQLADEYPLRLEADAELQKRPLDS